LSPVPCALLHRTSRVHNKKSTSTLELSRVHNKSTSTLCFLTQNFKSTQQVYWVWYPVLYYTELLEYTTKSLLVPCAFLHRTSRVHNKSTESVTLCFITQNRIHCKSTGTMCFLTQDFRNTFVHNNKSTGSLCFLILYSKRTQEYWYPVLSYKELQE